MKVLFFSLNAAIWQHALPENRLVREVSDHGAETVYVTCGKTFPMHCTSYMPSGIAVDAPRAVKDSICRLCEKNAAMLAAGNGARHLSLRDFVTTEDNSRADDFLAGVTRENYLELRFEGVEVGRATTYELFLTYKKMSTNLNEEEWNFFLVYLRNSLLALMGFTRIFSQEKPHTVFFYSPQYGTNGVCAEYAHKQGSRVYFTEGSSSNAERYKALRVWEWGVHGLVNPALSHWEKARSLLTTDDIQRVSGHFEELFRGRSFAVYSEPIQAGFSLRARFDIPDNSKIVLATLSSYDEAYAAYVIGKFPERKVKSPVFRDQFAWIKNTIAHIANRDDIFLIIRVHPRDYPNKRDPRQSEQAALWEKMFEARPTNVAINWPQDRISIYTILKQVDAVVTGWSATGTEALTFGVPVVTYDRFLPSYPADIHLTGDSVEEYYANIDRALAMGRSFHNTANAYRWLAASFSQGTVRIPAPRSIGENWPSSLPVRMLRKLIRILFDAPLRRLDAKRGMAPGEDKDRFNALVAQGASSLYDVLDANRASRITEPALDKAIRDETARFFHDKVS